MLGRFARNSLFISLIFPCMLAAAARTVPVQAAERPNIVWLLSEDNSKHYLKLFDEHGAEAPHIEAMARHGLVFEHAFSCSPVCSVARTTLMTSCYAPRVGTQFHRRVKLARLPDGWKLFPAELRAAGYYTTNNSKKDYNAVEGDDVWDASSRKATWRQRPSPETPFFHMHSNPASHESRLHFSRQQMQNTQTDTNPDSVALPPYFPDTELFRYTYAHYLDRMSVIDDWVGEIVDQLAADGLLEDTFIFYFGDHGGVLPRSKGYIYESGLHVPLVVRVPENWKHLVGRELGTRSTGFVSFVDFGPTVLNLAGVSIPEHVDGQPFLGPGVRPADVEQRNRAYGYADRFDEKYEMCRSLRKGPFKYIRNYQGYYPDALQNNYRYRMLAYRQWRSLYEAGKLNAAQRQFFESKPAELLFDLRSDPHEVRNLADDPRYAETCRELRGELQDWVKGLPDLSFYPESVLVEQALDAPVSFGRAHQDEIARLVDIADLSLLPFAQARDGLEAALSSDSALDRYWGLTACAVLGEPARPLVPQARELLEDPHLLVRVRAAEFLGRLGAADPRPAIMSVLATSESPVEALITLNAVVYLQDGPHHYEFPVTADTIRARGDGVSRRLEYLAP